MIFSSVGLVYIFKTIIYTNNYGYTPNGGDVVKLDTIGKNIRKYRLIKKLRQEDLAEKSGLTANYIGMMERGEKIPSLETFINILNALEVSADMVPADVVVTGYTVKSSILTEKLSKLSADDRERIYEVIDTMIKHSFKADFTIKLES